MCELTFSLFHVVYVGRCKTIFSRLAPKRPIIATGHTYFQRYLYTTGTGRPNICFRSSKNLKINICYIPIKTLQVKCADTLVFPHYIMVIINNSLLFFSVSKLWIIDIIKIKQMSTLLTASVYSLKLLHSVLQHFILIGQLHHSKVCYPK